MGDATGGRRRIQDPLPWLAIVAIFFLAGFILPVSCRMYLHGDEGGNWRQALQEVRAMQEQFGAARLQRIGNVTICTPDAATTTQLINRLRKQPSHPVYVSVTDGRQQRTTLIIYPEGTATLHAVGMDEGQILEAIGWGLDGLERHAPVERIAVLRWDR